MKTMCSKDYHYSHSFSMLKQLKLRATKQINTPKGGVKTFIPISGPNLKSTIVYMVSHCFSVFFLSNLFHILLTGLKVESPAWYHRMDFVTC